MSAEGAPQIKAIVISWSRAREEAEYSRSGNRFLTGAAPLTHSLKATERPSPDADLAGASG